LILSSAPILGKVRDSLLATFDRRFLGLLAVALALVGLVAFATALLRVREDRGRRYGLLVAAAGLIGLQVWWWQSGDARVDVVERVHLLEYGGLALLFHRAFAMVRPGLGLAPLTLLAVGTVGVLDELVQWWSAIRTGDQRDVWLNLFAGLIGVLVASALAPRAVTTGPFDRSGRAATSLAATLFLAGYGTLLEVAHLGHEAGDAEIRFRSFFPPERLPAMSGDRAARWGTKPPVLAAYAREDFYLTEAAWHVQARNAAWEAGDMTGAWVENRILELWYPPFLDLASFSTGVVHRWPASQRQEAEVGRAHPLPGGPGPYWSPVLAGRILIDPVAGRVRSSIWGGFVVALAGWLATAFSRRPALRS
jgi:hypothetical protein